MRYMILIHSNEAAEAVWREGGKERLDAAHAAVFQELDASANSSTATNSTRAMSP